MEPVEAAVVAVWALLPAYVPNNAAVVVGGGPPIDGGRRWRGDRLLGDGKTWRGTAGGVLAGVVLAVVLNAATPTAATALPLADFTGFAPGAMVGLPLGAMLGDLVASFAKRRTGRARGAAVPVVDQLDFLAGAVLVSLALAPPWTLATFAPPVLLAAVVLTPALHVAANVGAYALGLKDEPW
jgi:CDP-2,3-bis-(O-geranylgeranyl)-sn-glycerol synthase